MLLGSLIVVSILIVYRPIL